MRTLAALFAVVTLTAACTSSEPEATTEPTVSATTSATVAEPTTSTTTTLPATTSSTTTTSTTLPPTTTTVETAVTATTVWVDPPSTTSTTTPAPPDNEPPNVEITSPGNLSSHVAAYDPDLQAFRAVVSMSAAVSDPDDDRVTIDWFSSLSGYLGTGEFITASLVTLYDSSQPFITARATDEHGASSENVIQIIVWVPSDT